MRRRTQSDVEDDGSTERDLGQPTEDEAPPLPDDVPTWGPVENGEITGSPLIPDNLADPTRRKHPTILSEEGEEEAPADELPGGRPV